MQKHFFESLYKIFLILKLAPIVAQQYLWKGKTKFNHVTVNNLCRFKFTPVVIGIKCHSK